MDFYCKSATMFLYLTPSCCIQTDQHPPINGEETSPLVVRSNHFNVSPASNRKVSAASSTSSTTSRSSACSNQPEQTLEFMTYLYDAKSTIASCKKACKCWSAVYDGMDVVTENARSPGRLSTISHRLSLSSPHRSSFSSPESFFQSLSTSSDTNLSELLSDVPDIAGIPHTSDCLGPFLNALFDKIDSMIDNNLYVNLELTSLVTRLACYPQALLRSFLLNSNLLIQPGVRSLAQVCIMFVRYFTCLYANTEKVFGLMFLSSSCGGRC